MKWANPHVYFYIDVTDADGKNGSKLADAGHITLPDGRHIFGGTPGDGGPGDPTATKSGV
jgi:hypothetical protein